MSADTLHDRLLDLDERMIGKVVGADLGEELHVLLREAAEAVKPPAKCERCGNRYGVGGHGPGFCIDRRAVSGRGAWHRDLNADDLAVMEIDREEHDLECGCSECIASDIAWWNEHPPRVREELFKDVGAA